MVTPVGEGGGGVFWLGSECQILCSLAGVGPQAPPPPVTRLVPTARGRSKEAPAV